MTGLCRSIIEEGTKLRREIGYEESKHKIGIAGSIVRGEETEKSDIDLVVDYEMIPLEDMVIIEDYFSNKFNRSVDIVNLPLLEKEDRKIDLDLIEMGMGVDEYSIYKNIKREVIWFE